jgi:hypothetical protein
MLEERLQQMKLMDDREMNQGAAVGDDCHGREGEFRSASNSLSNHPSA